MWYTSCSVFLVAAAAPPLQRAAWEGAVQARRRQESGRKAAVVPVCVREGIGNWQSDSNASSEVCFGVRRGLRNEPAANWYILNMLKEKV